MSCNAGAEAVQSAEGNMSGAVMRGTAALPGSETSSRTKGSRRNLGDLLSPAAAQVVSGRGGKLSRAKPPRKAGGVGRLRTTDEAPNKADPVGGGGCGGKAAGSWGRQAATHAPDPGPDKACHRSGEPTGRGCGAIQVPNPGRAGPATGARCGKACAVKTAGRIPVSDRGSRERCFRVNRLTRWRKPMGTRA